MNGQACQQSQDTWEESAVGPRVFLLNCSQQSHWLLMQTNKQGWHPRDCFKYIKLQIYVTVSEHKHISHSQPGFVTLGINSGEGVLYDAFGACNFFSRKKMCSAACFPCSCPNTCRHLQYQHPTDTKSQAYLMSIWLQTWIYFILETKQKVTKVWVPWLPSHIEFWKLVVLTKDRHS